MTADVNGVYLQTSSPLLEFSEKEGLCISRCNYESRDLFLSLYYIGCVGVHVRGDGTFDSMVDGHSGEK